MAYEKSPGSNGITTEAFKNLDKDGFELLYRTIVRYWTDENYIPEKFTTIKLSMIPKTGDLSNPNKWRGIALQCRRHHSKINIIKNFITTNTTPLHIQNGRAMRIATQKRMHRRYFHTEESTTTTLRTRTRHARTICRPSESV